MSKRKQSQTPNAKTWLLLAGVFVIAVAVTLLIGLRGNSDEADPTDLGSIAENDPNLPANADPAPPFALPTLDGSIFDLAEHIATDGRPVVLNLWASWCPPCRAEMPDIDAVASEHADVLFIGVAVNDDAASARAFAEEIGITYTIAFDDGTVDDAYQVIALPATFFIKSDGTIAKNHFGVVTVESLNDDIAALFGG